MLDKADCQTKSDLDRKKNENVQQLNYSKSLLEKTGKSKNLSLNQLNLIQRNIELRQDIVNATSNEIELLKEDIDDINTQIAEIGSNITALKDEYAKLIVSASRNLDSDFSLMYIFSSQDFNQAYQRIKYLKYLSSYRKDLTVQLRAEEQNLVQRKSDLIQSTRKSEELLLAKKRELGDLEKDKKQNVSLISSLQQREAELKKDIASREKIQREIENQIRKLIEEDMARAKSLNKTNVLTPEEILVSNEFAKNKGRLPWPTEQGIITGKFGKQNHPVLKGITFTSIGIDINTAEGTKVRAVFDGEVTKVVGILGANYTVIIKHGEFRTVYQNLINVEVKAGDKVKTKTYIGTVYTDKDMNSKFHFMVWRDKITENPEDWLSK